jgi:hypothetical protein
MAAQYRLENRSVIHQHHYTGETILADADVHSFRVIVDSTIYQSPGVEARFAGKPVDIQNDWFAADSNSGWFMNRRIDGADPASFRGYYGGRSCRCCARCWNAVTARWIAPCHGP